MGWHLDGKVTAVVGTHTHVQTADERILPKGTAYLTDVGMTGPHDSVIGVEIERGARPLPDAMPARFETATGNPRLNAVDRRGRRADRPRDGHRATQLQPRRARATRRICTDDRDLFDLAVRMTTCSTCRSRSRQTDADVRASRRSGDPHAAEPGDRRPRDAILYASPS